jgi:hypothetical protein
VAARAGGSVFFLTDYGHADEFSGVVRAVLVHHAPGVPIIDLTHGVTPFDVRAGALALARAVPYLGPGVVLAVVDPGVGTARRPVALSVRSTTRSEGPQHFVGPDNGLLPWAAEALGVMDGVVELPRSPMDGMTTTFDGRDVFAPAAARLWQGHPLSALGLALDPSSLVRLPPPRLSASPGVLEAEVQWVDRFGNVQLAAGPDDDAAAELGDELEVLAARSHRVQRASSFAELGPGGLGLVVDANGRLSLVCDRDSAATVLGVQPGDVVTVRPVAPDPGPR